MKKLIIAASAVCLFAACSSDDSNTAGAVNYDPSLGYRVLHSNINQIDEAGQTITASVDICDFSTGSAQFIPDADTALFTYTLVDGALTIFDRDGDVEMKGTGTNPTLAGIWNIVGSQTVFESLDEQGYKLYLKIDSTSMDMYVNSSEVCMSDMALEEWGKSGFTVVSKGCNNLVLSVEGYTLKYEFNPALPSIVTRMSMAGQSCTITSTMESANYRNCTNANRSSFMQTDGQYLIKNETSGGCGNVKVKTSALLKQSNGIAEKIYSKLLRKF